ncbi:hypothetical protein ABH922_002004 [Rhodococcus sp. 27YEA15]|uniref:hypothetical protein n=1 Tax=Rhodococcus sp. 27YEA15 TaxID=3156259 RepID=UPI003C7C2FB0
MTTEFWTVAADTAGADELTVRTYGHGALGDRRVVRLVPGNVGEAEDLALDYLGFETPQVIAAGATAKRTIGFPAWTLVYDRPNAAYALSMVKEFTRLRALAGKRAGFARDGFVELSTRIADRAPRTLPTFFEEAGRAFVEAGNPSFAAGMFGKARAAEGIYALEVDEERLREVFLEFAFAGALTGKSMTDYSKALATRNSAEVAYLLFRQLCVRRTAGGLVPYAGLVADLRKLGKSAGVGADEVDSILVELIEYPALGQAPAAFWRSARTAVGKLARDNPSVCRRMLEIMPQETYTATFAEEWLSLLADAGSLELLRDAESGFPSDGAAGWLNRYVRLRAGNYRARSATLLDLVGQLAPRLRAENTPIEVSGRWQVTELDLLDLAIAEDIPVVVSADSDRCALSAWIADDQPGRRHLTALQTSRYSTILRSGLDEMFGGIGDGTPAEAAVRDKPLVEIALSVDGLRDEAVSWLRDLLADAVGGGIPQLSHFVNHFAALNSMALHREAQFVEEFTNLTGSRELSAASALTRSLRIGLFAEMGWPAFEHAVAGLLPDMQRRTSNSDDRSVDIRASWPHVVLSNGSEAVVVGATAEVARHTFAVPSAFAPSSWSTPSAVWVDGEFLVRWYSAGGGYKGYWSSRPHEVFDLADGAWQWRGHDVQLPLPGGGITTAGKPFHAGEKRSYDTKAVAGDGTDYWILHAADRTLGWYEFDPTLGTVGRAASPPFFTAGLESEDELDVLRSFQLPLDAPRSPLGVSSGTVGLRVSSRGGQVTAVRVDGKSATVTRSPACWEVDGQVAVVDWPGSDTVLQVVDGGAGWMLTTADGAVISDRYRNPVSHQIADRFKLPPTLWWNYLEPRDLAGSAALRTFTIERAVALLDAVSAAPTSEDALSAVGKECPEITAPQLVRKILEAVREAERNAECLEVLSAPPTRRDDDLPSDDALTALARPFEAHRYHYYYGGNNTAKTVRWADQAGRALALLAEGIAAADGELTSGGADWLRPLQWWPALTVSALSPAADPAARLALAGLLEFAVDRGLFDPEQRWYAVSRIGEWNEPTGIEVRDGTPVAMLRSGGRYDHPRTGGLLSLRSGLALPAVFDESRALTRYGDAERVRAAVEVLRGAACVPWQPDRVDELAARTGLGRAESALVLLGFATFGTQQSTAELKEIRALVAVSAAEFTAASRALTNIDADQRAEILGAALPADPRQLVTDGYLLDALAALWSDVVGVRRQLPDALLVESNRALQHGDAEMIGSLLNSESTTWLHGDSTTDLSDPHGVRSAREHSFSGDRLPSVLRVMRWLTYQLDGDSPLRAHLDQARELTARRLAAPGLLCQIGYAEERGVTKLLRTVFTSLSPGDRVPEPKPATDQVFDLGVLAVVVNHASASLWVRPARLADAPAGLADLLAPFESGWTTCLHEVETVQALCTRESGFADTGYIGEGRDPRRSAAAVVQAVADEHGLSEQAATYYLQLAALPDPTDAHVKRWNEWKPKDLSSARTELVASGLCVEAKRARAGRSVFLPGAWLELRAPRIPVEQSKVHLFGYEIGASLGGSALVPTASLPQLFEQVWADRGSSSLTKQPKSGGQ